MYRTKITIRGTVQHVGLRAQIKTIADGLGVCGTVENLEDGSVLVVCEAGRADIEEMVRQIRSGTELAAITDVLVEEGPPATGIDGFEVMRGDSAGETFSAISAGTRAMVGMLATLKEMKQGQARLEKGQNRTNETLERLEQGQARLEKGQDRTNETLERLEQGQARLEKGQARLEKGQNRTNETLERLEQGQIRLEQGQTETKDAIKSMDSNWARHWGTTPEALRS